MSKEKSTDTPSKPAPQPSLSEERPRPRRISTHVTDSCPKPGEFKSNPRGGQK